MTVEVRICHCGIFVLRCHGRFKLTLNIEKNQAVTAVLRKLALLIQAVVSEADWPVGLGMKQPPHPKGEGGSRAAN